MAKISTVVLILAGVLILTSLVSASGMLAVVNYTDPTPSTAPQIIGAFPSSTSASSPTFIGPPEPSSWAPTIIFSYASSSTGLTPYVTSASLVIYSSSGSTLNSQNMFLASNDSTEKTTEWTVNTISDSSWPATGHMTYTYTYFDHSSSGNSNSATLTYTTYWSLVSPPIVGTWVLDGVTVTSTTQVINVTSATLHIYFIPTTTTLPYVKSIYVVVKEGSTTLSNTTASLQGNNTYSVSYTLPAYGTYNVQGYVHNETSTVQTLSMLVGNGTSPPPSESWFFALTEFQLGWMSYVFYAGLLFAVIGFVTKFAGL